MSFLTTWFPLLVLLTIFVVIIFDYRHRHPGRLSDVCQVITIKSRSISGDPNHPEFDFVVETTGYYARADHLMMLGVFQHLGYEIISHGDIHAALGEHDPSKHERHDELVWGLNKSGKIISVLTNMEGHEVDRRGRGKFFGIRKIRATPVAEASVAA